MADNSVGDNFVKNIESPYVKAGNALSDLGKTASDTIDKADNFLKGKGYTPSTKPDTSWHDSMVKSANESFKNEAAKKAASPPSPKPTPKPSYKKGTDYVPKTGPAQLHKGEAVLNKDDADKLRTAKGKTMNSEKAIKSVADELGGHKEATPKKEIKHIVTRKAHGGKGHIHTHVHTHPEAHPDEEHVTNGDDEMAEHMMQNMGTPNPGEAEADAGQSGIPAAAAPQAGASAGAPAPGPMGA